MTLTASGPTTTITVTGGTSLTVATPGTTGPAGADGTDGAAAATAPLAYDSGTHTISISGGTVAGQGLRWSGSAWAISQFGFADITGTAADAQVTLSNVQQWLRSLTRGIATVQGTANESALDVSGYSLTGSSTVPMIKLRGTWNTTGAPNLIDIDLTVTAANNSANIVNWTVGSLIAFRLTRFGGAQFDSLILGSSTQSWLYGASNGLITRANCWIGWSASTTSATFTPDLLLHRDAAGTLAQRNGTNAQTSRIYKTYTDAANYERAYIGWSGNIARLGTEAGGTGTKRSLVVDINTLSADPTTSDLPAGSSAVFHNSTSGVTKIWANVGGTLKSVALS